MSEVEKWKSEVQKRKRLFVVSRFPGSITAKGKRRKSEGRKWIKDFRRLLFSRFLSSVAKGERQKSEGRKWIKDFVICYVFNFQFLS